MTDTTEAGVDRPTLSGEPESSAVAVLDEPAEVAADQEASEEPAEAVFNAADAFAVHLENFEGPFDLLLGLISKHKLDVTEVALAQVTNEFIAYIRARGDDWDLGQATEFLVVASTLLDLKAARLLPSAEVEDEDDLALLEARDLLFARLLQYRAYKDVSAEFAKRIAAEARRHPRTVALDSRFSSLLPEVLISIGPDAFAALAAKALTPKVPAMVAVEHIHAPRVSVREQGAILIERLRRQRATTFRSLTADCPDTLTVVARFLALLELFRDGAVQFDQVTALGELRVRWTGSDDDDEIAVSDEFDIEPVLDADEGVPADEVTDADLLAAGTAPTASTAETDPTDPVANAAEEHA